MTSPTGNSQQGWQPIETHQGDTSECLIAVLDQHGRLYVADRGWWQPGAKHEEWDEVEDGVRIKLWEDEDEGSWLSNHGYLDDPTHWMPLPPAPGEGQ